MKEFRFMVKNEPGALEEVASTLAEQHVNIEGIAGIGLGDNGLIRLVTDNPGNTRRVLEDLGAEFEEKEALAINLPNHPGELATLLRRLADDGINVESCYAGVERNKLVLAVDKVAQAKQLLRIA